jgi:hypothetical protein
MGKERDEQLITNAAEMALARRREGGWFASSFGSGKSIHESRLPGVVETAWNRD